MPCLREQALIIIDGGALLLNAGEEKLSQKTLLNKWVVLKQSMMGNHLKIQGCTKNELGWGDSNQKVKTNKTSNKQHYRRGETNQKVKTSLT